MLTEYEAQKLTQSMHVELNATRGAVWRCVTGLAIVISLAWAGSLIRAGDSESHYAARMPAQTQDSMSTTEVGPQKQAETEVPAETAQANANLTEER